MIGKTKAEYPEYKVLLTFFSPSNYRVWKNYKGVGVIRYFLPDTPFWTRKPLNPASPAIAIFIKYEFWGNYLCELQKQGAPVYIIPIISRPDQLLFRWFGKPYRKMLSYLSHPFA